VVEVLLFPLVSKLAAVTVAVLLTVAGVVGMVTVSEIVADGPLVACRDRSQDEIRDIGIVTGSALRRFQSAGWKIPGCPVNGPQLDSRGKTAVSDRRLTFELTPPAASQLNARSRLNSHELHATPSRTPSLALTWPFSAMQFCMPSLITATGRE
jgi:hypothetical protein